MFSSVFFMVEVPNLKKKLNVKILEREKVFIISIHIASNLFIERISIFAIIVKHSLDRIVPGYHNMSCYLFFSY